MSATFDGPEYQARVDALAAGGMNMHGEADLLRSLRPSSVLDAGCGTGRVAIELARHGIDVVGVDVEASMIAQARILAPDLTWVEADLVGLDLRRSFDVVVLAGNIPLFSAPGTNEALIGSCATHVNDAGSMVAGFQLGRGFTPDDYDAACSKAGFRLAERWSTWDRQTFGPGAGYAVSLHRRCAPPAPPPAFRR